MEILVLKYAITKLKKNLQWIDSTSEWKEQSQEISELEETTVEITQFEQQRKNRHKNN